MLSLSTPDCFRLADHGSVDDNSSHEVFIYKLGENWLHDSGSLDGRVRRFVKRVRFAIDKTRNRLPGRAGDAFLLGAVRTWPMAES